MDERRATDALPVFDVADDLREVMDRVGAAVLVAPPGTGKTTGVPPLLADEAWAVDGRILVLEPRRLAARLAATRMATNAGEDVGARFGYSVRGERRVSASTRVEVITEGLLLRRLQRDPALDGVSAVLLDEFHERSIDTDLALALLLDVRGSLRPDLRLLVMSATLDAAPVAELLGGVDGRAAVLEAQAPMFPVDVRHRPGSLHDPLEERVATVVSEALRTDPGDVLVFLPGRGEIGRTARRLGGAPGDGPVEVQQLHGSLGPSEQDEVVRGAPGGRRRVILSTSIAESSVTVPGVRVVVDAGRRRAQRVDQRTGLPILATGPSSRASADQRAGRAGRLAPGVAYRLWGEPDHRHRPVADTPEIVDGDLAALVLQTLAWGVSDPTELRWLDVPPAAAVERARDVLSELGAVDEVGALSTAGRAMAALGFHPRFAAIGLAGRDRGHAAIAADVLAVLETARSGDADIVERVRALRAGRSTGDTVAAARQWRRALTAPDDERRAEADELEQVVGDLLLVGFPDRVAKRRRAQRTSGSGRPVTVFHLRSGGEVALPDDALHLEQSDWLVVADLDGGDEERSGRVHLAAAIDVDTLRRELADRFETIDEVRWDPRTDEIRSTRRVALGAITVREQPLSDPSRAAVSAAMRTAVRSGGIGLLGRAAEADELRARVACLRALDVPGGVEWPDWSDTALLDSIDEWLGPRMDRARRRADLDRIDVRTILFDRLDWRRRQLLDELAPRTWAPGSGRSVRLHYGALDGEPASVLASVRLSDLLGVDRHPSVAGGRLPITIELLSPARRPVQRTTDLPGFWRGSYAAVRSDLRGRYPKHPWPERPWEPRR